MNDFVEIQERAFEAQLRKMKETIDLLVYSITAMLSPDQVVTPSTVQEFQKRLDAFERACDQTYFIIARTRQLVLQRSMLGLPLVDTEDEQQQALLAAQQQQEQQPGGAPTTTTTTTTVVPTTATAAEATEVIASLVNTKLKEAQELRNVLNHFLEKLKSSPSSTTKTTEQQT